MDRFDDEWRGQRRRALGARLAALVCVAISSAAIALKVVPVG